MRVLCVQCHRPSCLWKNSNCFSHWIDSTTDLKVQRHCCCVVANTVGNFAYLTVCCAGDSGSFARSQTPDEDHHHAVAVVIHKTGNDLQEEATTHGSEPLNRIQDHGISVLLFL